MTVRRAGVASGQADRRAVVRGGVRAHPVPARQAIRAAWRKMATIKATTKDVGCNLSPEEAQRLARYAKRHELSVQKLCALFILHEVRSPSLASSAARFGGSDPRAGSVRVTARVSAKLKDDFVELAEAQGMGVDDAAAVVFRAELADGWLARTVGRFEENRP